ncbi:MAG TPA: alpha/beta hydrolase [Candidatus Binatia bacterium]
MAQPYQIKRYVRPFPEVRHILMERAREQRNPFAETRLEDVTAAFSKLSTLEPAAWAAVFSEVALPHEEKAKAAEAAGNKQEARDSYLAAFATYRIARYPAPNSPAKTEAYLRSKDNWLKAARFFQCPPEVVEIPFRPRAGSAAPIKGYLYRPSTSGPHPMVVSWGGIDGYKEDRLPGPFLQENLLLLSVDMPGVGEAPINGSQDHEAFFDALFGWARSHPEVGRKPIAAMGASTGGYWAARVAHTHADFLRAVVNHGGPVHFAFQPDWIEKAQFGEYPFELGETLAFAFGLESFDDWVQHAGQFSLLDQGILDNPAAPLLCLNGVDDSIFPIRDHYLLMEHGSPKTARFYPGGHMGPPEARALAVRWVADMLHRQ